MKIRYKLMLGFLVIAFMIWVVGYFAVSTSQKALQKSIEESSVFLVVKIMDTIDKNILRRIEEFNAYSKNLIVQDAVFASNQQFDKLDDIETYITEKDEEWTSVPKKVTTPFMQELIENNLSRSLREKMEYYQKKYGYRVFGEVIVTNKYGANVALSGKTTDYKQDDEQWWQSGKEDRLYIGDIEYDESSGVYATNFGIRIDDEYGNFLGVMKVALNIEDITYIIKDFEPMGMQEEQKTAYVLATKEGKLIYSTGEFEFLKDVHDYIEHIEHKEPGEHKHGVLVRKDKKHGGVLCAHTHSNFKALDWILLVEHKTKVIFAPVIKLRNGILVTSVIVTLLAVMISFFFSRSISKPVIKLRDAAIKIGRGDLDTKIDIKTKDEIGELADSFKKMSEDLKTTTVSKEYVDNIMDSMIDTLIVVDSDGKIKTVNRATCNLLGYKEKELIGKPVEILSESKNMFVGETKLRELIDDGKVINYETEYKTKLGATIPMLFSGSVMMDKDGAISCIVCTASDITERKQAEEKLQRYAEELEQMNEEVKSFAYIVSHDLRAPLVNLKGFSEELTYSLKESKALLDKCIAYIDEKDRVQFTALFEQDVPEAIGFITSSVNRMDNLINAILKLSRIGRRDLAPAPTNMEELVQPILKSLTHQVGQHKGQVTVGALPEVVVDKTAMEQIMGNLLDNAVKYLDPERPGKIEISAEKGHEKTIFHVRDNGRGIEQKDMHKVFEIFRRAGKDDVRGEGMGLAYVRTLIRRHGGRIWCESEPNVGTTFSFTVPHKLRAEDRKAA